MKPIKDLRREHLAALSEKHGGQSALANILKRDRNQVYQWLLPADNPASRGIGDKMARHIEASLNLANGALDNVQWMSSDAHTQMQSVSAQSVSRSDATLRDDHHTPVRTVRIEGAVKMDEHGFWQQGDRDAEHTRFPTDDVDAYAIRILSQHFQPSMASGQCILVSPNSELKPGRPVIVILMDGRRTLRNFYSHERGMWAFTKVNDGNAFIELADADVAYVERVMAYLWTD
jgi:hypothetical protein